jgi:hypothetical protein
VGGRRRMSRALHIEFPGAYYHLMNRGRGREVIEKNWGQGKILRRDLPYVLAYVRRRAGKRIRAHIRFGNEM